MAAVEAAGVIPISSGHKPERNIYQRINAVMHEVRGVQKSGFNTHAKYNYAGHEAVTEAVRDAFVKHGIVQTVSMVSCETLDGGVVRAHVRVSWFCDDCPSSCIVSDSWAVQPAQTKDKSLTAQQVGQAMSYAVKNVFFKQLMLTGDPERDSDEAPDDAPSRRSEPPPRDDGARADAEIYLAEFRMCKTAQEVDALKKRVRDNWQSLRSIKGYAEDVARAATDAYARIKAGA